MEKKANRKITSEVSQECYIELNVLAARKDTSLAATIKEILEKAMSKYIKQAVTTEESQ
jgi:hypothetical protein